MHLRSRKTKLYAARPKWQQIKCCNTICILKKRKTKPGINSCKIEEPSIYNPAHRQLSNGASHQNNFDMWHFIKFNVKRPALEANIWFN